MEIELPILYNNDDTAELAKLEIDMVLSLNDVREVTFYNIDAIAYHFDDMENDKEYCRIFSSGEQFICNMKYNEVKERIRQKMNGRKEAGVTEKVRG